MDKQRDEFQELIRNFSLDDTQLRRSTQPSVQSQPQYQPRERPARQPAARPSSSEIGEELLRGFSPSGSGQPSGQAPYRQNVRQQQNAPGQAAPRQPGFEQPIRQGGYPSAAGRGGTQQAASQAAGRNGYPQGGYRQNVRQQGPSANAVDSEPQGAPPTAMGQESYAQNGYPPSARQQGPSGNPANAGPQGRAPFGPGQQAYPQGGYRQNARRQSFTATPAEAGPQGESPRAQTARQQSEPMQQSALPQQARPVMAQARGAAQQSASRFDPAGFQPSSPRQEMGAPASETPAQPASQPGMPQPPQGAAQNAASRFNAAGFQAPAGRQGGVPLSLNKPNFTPPSPQKDFELHISDPDYNNIPDSAGGGGQPPSSTPSSTWKEPPKRRRRRRRGRAARFFEALVLVLGAVALAVALAIFALESAGDMLGMNKPDIEAEITISETDTLTELAETLQEAGIIEQPLTFEIYARLLKKDGWQSGTYSLNTKMAYSQILNRFQRGNVEQETVRIMFPEGQTIIQIAEKLEENNVCSAEDFLDAADSGSYDFQFEDQIPHSPLRFHRLEGYIFPDTYDFYIGQNPESVVRRFLEIFNTRVTQDLYDLMEKRGMTLDETITLASIIQKETGNVENMYYVSSVFHNRLAAPEAYPRLQSDATTDYVENTIKPNLSSENQEMCDAYDTYTCEGLPVGPINNPSLNAIKAALDPLETNYYFFLSDQKGEYHFSENINQHNAYLADAGEAHGTAIDHSADA